GFQRFLIGLELKRFVVDDDTVEIEENGVDHLASLAIEFVERRKILRRVSKMEQIREVSAKEKSEGSE
ncbi:hypothetical protein OFC18_29215, partial [Escherichia coli]|nr:hypothetical protein [Escherichia coli]